MLQRGVVDGESWLLGEYDSKRNWFHVRYKAQGIGMDRGPDGAVVGWKWGPTKVPYVGCQRATGQLRRFSRAQASECLREQLREKDRRSLRAYSPRSSSRCSKANWNTGERS